MGGKRRVGVVASKGIVCGPVMIFRRTRFTVSQDHLGPEETAEACTQYLQAVEQAKEQLRQEADGPRGEIFGAYLTLLDDFALRDMVLSNIREQLQNPQLALRNAVDSFCQMLESMDNPYMRERCADLRDIRDRLTALLRGEAGCQPPCPSEEQPVILAADDLTPSDTIHLNARNTLGFIIEQGGVTSHVSIIARSMGVPAIVGAQGILEGLEDGTVLILDALEGTVTRSPDGEQLAEYHRQAAAWQDRRRAARQAGRRPAVTRDGRTIQVCANIGSLTELEEALNWGADGVGLLRSEFLYLNRKTLPDEEEQFAVYRQAAASGLSITIRTLDAGGDKGLACLPIPEESNPFLGYRAIRICLDQTELFCTQLRAILRASAFGRLRIMFPMLISLEELSAARELLERCKEELRQEGHAFDEAIPVGMMMETPAAVTLAPFFARSVDFFSIGTNDLTQYTLAVDRGNPKVQGLYDSLHPAVLHAIARIARAGREAGIQVGMCGELAADPRVTQLLLGMGLDELSMAAGSISEIKEMIRSSDSARAGQLAGEIEKAAWASEIQSLLDRNGQW